MTRTHWTLLLFALLLCAAYAAGLPGEFALDDAENFADLRRFERGDLGWQGVVAGNASGPLGRPLSMASFALTAALAGLSPLSIKLGNLSLHLVCGALIAILLRAVLRDGRLFAGREEPVAVLLAAWWMALPIHVSTVLYAVQRMTQLSAIVSVLAVLAYVHGRRLAAAGGRGGLAMVWIGVPALALLAALGKENGLLALPLCAVLEWTVLGRSGRAPAAIRAFAWTVAVVPVLGLAAILLLSPGSLLEGYAVRSFTLAERLLTEPRVLWSYVADVLVPFGPSMGLIQDDVVLSRSWTEPATTVPAILAWLAVAGVALGVRRRLPLVSLGVGWFLVGHALESSVIPLELYFEHRNYLPSLGVLLVVAGFVAWIAGHVRKPTPQFRYTLPVLAVALAAAYVAGTYARAGVWRSEEDLVAHALQHHPDSSRLNSILGAHAMAAGDLPQALRYFDLSAQGLGSHERPTVVLWSLVAHCYARTAVPQPLLDELHGHAPDNLSSFGVQAVITAADAIYQQVCDDATADATIAALRPWLAAMQANPDGRGSWRFRYEYGRMLATRGAYREALDLIEPAWRQSGWQVGIGVVAFQIAVATEDLSRVEPVFARLSETAPAWDYQLQEALVRFRARVQSMRAANPPS